MHCRLLDSLFLFSVVLLVFVSGCDSRPKRVPISGKVLIDGEPLKFGCVTFVPETGRQSSGIIDASGNFKLTCFEPGDGALLGKHRVEVLAGDAINITTTRWYAPRKYADKKTSGLVQDVTGPNDSVVLELTWKGNTPNKQYDEHAEADVGEEAFAKRRGKK